MDVTHIDIYPTVRSTPVLILMLDSRLGMNNIFLLDGNYYHGYT